MIRIGCSGWNYDHWRGRFYPEDLPADRWFEHYARTFRTVEINYTFYRLPDAKVFDRWAEQADPGFVYAIKGNRYITHMKKLKDSRQPVRKFLVRARRLEDRLGPILWQLPPRWKRNLDRLEGFLDVLPDDLEHVFEFRDDSWHVDEVLELLDDRGASFCTHDMEGLEPPRVAVGPVAYVRFHGTRGRYGGGYPEPSLRPWAKWLDDEHERGRDIYAYFNNDVDAHAVHDAQILQKKLTGSRTRRAREG